MKKEFTVNKRDIKRNFIFIPVQSEMDFDKKMSQDPFSLPMGKYDIDFVITFCRILLEKIERYKIRPQDLPLTLMHSIKRLMSMLEVEKDQMK